MQPRRDLANRNDARLILGILESVERGGNITQRSLATEMQLALGLINSYLRWCVTTGLIKVRQVNCRRFVYYLTPSGFAEKSRLAASHPSRSFDFFRQARLDCRETLQEASAQGLSRVVLVGASDLAEIAVICAIESPVSIVAAVDDRVSRTTFLGGFRWSRASLRPGPKIDGAIITDMTSPIEVLDRTVGQLGRERVFVPKVLRGVLQHPKREVEEAPA